MSACCQNYLLVLCCSSDTIVTVLVEDRGIGLSSSNPTLQSSYPLLLSPFFTSEIPPKELEDATSILILSLSGCVTPGIPARFAY